MYHHASGYYLSPFFSKMVTMRLVAFSNRFIELPGLPNFIQSLNPNDGFRLTVEVFERDSLRF